MPVRPKIALTGVATVATLTTVALASGAQVFAHTQSQVTAASSAAASRPVMRAAAPAIRASAHRLARATTTAGRLAVRADARAVRPSNTGGGSARAQAATAPPAASPTVSPSLLSQFQGTSESAAIAAFGSDQRAAPPDPAVAVGPSAVVEATNSSLQFFTRAGSSIGIVDINAFVGVPTHWTTTDPRVVYDPQSGRFYFSVLEFDATGGNGNQVALLASNTGDPAGTWSGYTLPNVAPNCTDSGCNSSLPPFADQPSLGMSDNVVAVTWNYFNGPSLTAPWYGSQIDIVQKSDLAANVLTANTVAAFYNGPFAPQPVVSLDSTGVQYIVYNNSDPIEVGNNNSIGVFPITGQPEQQNVPTPSEFDAGPYQATAIPPGAAQNGTTVQIDTGDDRLLNAVWKNGVIWTAGATGSATGNGCAAGASCLNLTSIPADAAGTVNTSGAVQIVSGVSGGFQYYPAISLDGGGNPVVVFDQSSASAAESLMVAGISGGHLTSPVTLRTSATFYDPGGGLCAGTPVSCRWGDYSGVAQDPSHPTDVWVVSEDTDGNTSSACTTANQCWNTFIGRYTYAGPTIANLAPGAGPVSGGQTLTVNGSDFLPGSTVTFAGSPVTPAALTPDSFQLTTPSHAAGLVTVTVTDSLGSASSNYVYTGLGSYFPLTPFRILDTRTGLCGLNTCHRLGPGGTLTLPVTGYSDPTSHESVPGSATAVVLNVTAVSGTSFSLFTAYPTGTAQPLASNLNFNAGTNTANLVTAVLGQSGEINIFNALGNVDAVADVEGYFASQAASNPQGEFHTIAPVRVCDTRAGAAANPCNGNGADPSDNVLGPGQSLKVNVTQVGTAPNKIPSDGTAGAAVFNLTAVAGTAPTYLSLFPTDSTGSCPFGGSKPAAPTSNINVLSGAIQANRVMVPLGPDVAASSGHPNPPTLDVCVFNSAGTINFILDANGWYGGATATATAAQFQAIGPSRVCDTRPGSGEPCQGSTLAPNTSLLVAVAGVGGVPSMSATNPPLGVIANLTAVQGSIGTYLALYPAGGTVPNTSDLNIAGGQILPNLVVVKLAAAGSTSPGEVDLYNSVGSINAVIDIEGWFQ